MNDLVLNGDAPVLMGIVNVTPDSFSDGGRYLSLESAVAHALRLIDEGAAILDIGGESTRPGSDPVDPQEEIRRVVPVIESLQGCGVLISVDTRNAETMRAALAAGAGMINDVSAFTHDPDGLRIAAESGAWVCLMHMKGDPKTMQQAPCYDDVLQEVFDYLSARIAACVSAGIEQSRIVIDPGIGFGKTLDHNLTVLNNLDKFHDLDVGVMLGASRKRFIEAISPGAGAERRLPGSLAACCAAYQKGIRLFRVHDVSETAQALAVYRRIIDNPLV